MKERAWNVLWNRRERKTLITNSLYLTLPNPSLLSPSPAPGLPFFPIHLTNSLNPLHPVIHLSLPPTTTSAFISFISIFSFFHTQQELPDFDFDFDFDFIFFIFWGMIFYKIQDHIMLFIFLFLLYSLVPSAYITIYLPSSVGQNLAL